MNRKKEKYFKSMNQQLYEKLSAMLLAGEGKSKKEEMKKGNCSGMIFSYDSYHSYYRQCKEFVKYVNKHYPDCTSLKVARKYVGEFLKYQTDKVDKNGNHLSAWTISLQRQALNKLYNISPGDSDFYTAPKRRREDIKRSRIPVERDKHFSKTNNDEFIKYCISTGCRRNVICKLKGKNLITRDDIEKAYKRLKQQSGLSEEEILEWSALRNALPMPGKEITIYSYDIDGVQREYYGTFSKAEILDRISQITRKSNLSPKDMNWLMIYVDAKEFGPEFEYYILHEGDKNGKSRISPIYGPYADIAAERMKNTEPNQKVWEHVPRNADIHSYRDIYATNIYKHYERDIKDIPFDAINNGSGQLYQSGVYSCRKDEKGRKLDKEAMRKASKALGHNRLDVVANNYIRGL